MNIRYQYIKRLLPALMSAAMALAAPAAVLAQQDDSGGGTLTLGHSGALSGPLAELGKDYLGGAMLYFDHVNALGGIHGQKVNLIAVDDGYVPDQAEENVRQLIEKDRVLALFGCFGTGPSARGIPLATAAKVPFFAPYTGADTLRMQTDPYVFHLRASYADEIEAMVNHLANLGVTAIGVVHHEDPFGAAGMAAARSALTRRGIEPALVAPIKTSGENAAEVAAAVAKAHPAALILITAGNSSPMLLRALKATDAHPMLYGLSVISSRQLVRELGDDAHGLALAQVVPSPFRVNQPLIREYRQRADSAGADYSYTAFEGYLAAKTMGEALSRAGKAPSREAVRQALESLNGWDAGGLQVRFSPQRHVGLDFVDLSILSRESFAR